MISIGICDDEIEQRFKLKRILETECALRSLEFRILEYSSGESLITKLEEDPYRWDIVCLDIEMGELNGMEVAYRIRQVNSHCIIIFITGFSEYVFDGYEVGALHYLMKPSSLDKIKEIFGRALDQLKQLPADLYVVKTKEGTFKIPYHQILYIYSDRRKVTIVTAQQECSFYGKLDEVEAELGPAFIRSHQRYLVRGKAIKVIQEEIILENGTEIPISAQRYKSVMIAFAKSLLT